MGILMSRKPSLRYDFPIKLLIERIKGPLMMSGLFYCLSPEQAAYQRRNQTNRCMAEIKTAGVKLAKQPFNGFNCTQKQPSNR